MKRLVIMIVCLTWLASSAQGQVKFQVGIGGSLPEFKTAFAHGAVVMDLPMGFKLRPNIGVGRNFEKDIWLTRGVCMIAHPVYKNILLGLGGGCVWAFTPQGVKLTKIGVIAINYKFHRFVLVAPFGISEKGAKTLSMELAYTF